MAKAPQKVTRSVARRMLAPSALAPMAPRKPRKSRDATETASTSTEAGDTSTMRSGIAAPTLKVASEVSAA